MVIKLFYLALLGVSLFIVSCKTTGDKQSEDAQGEGQGGVTAFPGAGPIAPVPDMAQSVGGGGSGVGQAAKSKAFESAGKASTGSLGSSYDEE
jgi:hypothetical protein